MTATKNEKARWFQKSILETEKILETNLKSGLNSTLLSKHQSQYGTNEIVETGGRSPLKIIFEQLFSTMVLILIAAVVVSAFLGDLTEVIAIAAIVVLFVVLGFVQEYKAEKAMAALKKMSVPLVRVLRNGKEEEIKATKLVPGDIILLEAGNIVPADGRIIESANLRVQESALTGESEAIEKHSNEIKNDELPVGDRKNMVHMGTVVSYGRGKVVITDTGMKTELGKIAELIQSVKPQLTPLQKQLDGVGKMLAVAGAVVAGVVMVIGFIGGGSFEQMLLTAVSVAVAVVPEGLPAVVTITLALGAQRMLKRHALIRKLPAVETLGSVNIICSDKTGTLTENRMTATVLDIAGKSLGLLNKSKNTNITISDDINGLFKDWPSALGLTLIGGVLCNDSSIKSEENGIYMFHGDPTEGALLVAGKNAGINKIDIEKTFPRVDEVPFESERKRMTTVHDFKIDKSKFPPSLSEHDFLNSKYIVYTKGSVDGLLNISKQVLSETGIEELDSNWKKRIEEANNKLASKRSKSFRRSYKRN